MGSNRYTRDEAVLSGPSWAVWPSLAKWVLAKQQGQAGLSRAKWG